MKGSRPIDQAGREARLLPGSNLEALRGDSAAVPNKMGAGVEPSPRQPETSRTLNVPAFFCSLLLAGAWIASFQYAHRMTYSLYPLMGYTVLAIVTGTMMAVWRRALAGGSGLLERVFAKRAGLARVAICLMAGIAGLYLRWRLIAPVSDEATGDVAMLFDIARFASGSTVSPEFVASYSRYLALMPSSFGYPAYVLARIFALTGESVRALLMTNLVFTAAGIALACNLVRLSFGPRAMVQTALLLSFWPSSIMAAREATAIPYFVMCLLIVLNIFASLFRDGNGAAKKRGFLLLLLILAGILLGHMTFLRPEGHITALAALFALTTCPAPRLGADNHRASNVALSVRWFRLAIVLLPMLLTIMITRDRLNYLVGQISVFGPGELGYNFLVGMNVGAGGVWNQQDADFYRQLQAGGASAFQVQWACFQAGWARFIADPLGSLRLIADAKRLYVWQSDISLLSGISGQYPFQLLYISALGGATLAAFKSFLGRTAIGRPLFTVLGGLILYSVICEARVDTQMLTLPLVLATAGGFSVQGVTASADALRAEDAFTEKETHVMTEEQLLGVISAGNLCVSVTQACLEPMPGVPEPLYLRSSHGSGITVIPGEGDVDHAINKSVSGL